MMRHILRDLEWGIALVVITLAIFNYRFANYQTSNRRSNKTDIAPGQIHCRSEQVLTDDAGHKWDVMFFTEVDSPEVTSLNLRLSGLYSSANIESQKPLIISTANKSYKATDIFLENPPLPSIGQYNLKNIFPRLSITNLTLDIPLENGKTAHLDIPQSLFEEWQQVADKNYHPFPKLPYTFEFMC